jgi:hypothetical protein
MWLQQVVTGPNSGEIKPNWAGAKNLRGTDR